MRAMEKADEVLDVSGMACPQPVLQAKKALKQLKRGNVLMVIATDKTSKKDIPEFVKRTGNELLDIKEQGGEVIFLIKKVR